MRTFIALIVSCVFCLGLAHARPVTPSPSEIEKQAESEWEFGVGAFGAVIGSFMFEPSEEDKRFTFMGAIVDIPYSGFAGVGGGGGITASALYKGVIGLELQLFNAQEAAGGHLDIGGTRHKITLTKSVWHLPLMLKLAAPTSGVRPFLFGGIDFVLSGDAEIDTTLRPADASAESYSAVTFGLGFDFLLPIPGQDIRIPLMLRGSRNLGQGESVEDLMDLDNCRLQGSVLTCGNTYRTSWHWQAFVSLGLSYHFPPPKAP
jgi:hypothetical protein